MSEGAKDSNRKWLKDNPADRSRVNRLNRLKAATRKKLEARA